MASCTKITAHQALGLKGTVLHQLISQGDLSAVLPVTRICSSRLQIKDSQTAPIWASAEHNITTAFETVVSAATASNRI